jgi:alpha-1,2-mannosyltransferase
VPSAIQRPFRRAGVQRASAVALVLLAFLLGVQTWHRAHRPAGNDFTSYLQAARAIATGSSPYDVDTPFPYVYPPLPALALRPLAMLPYGAAVIVWFLLSVAALAWTLVWLSRRMLGRGAAEAWPIAAIVLLLGAEVVQNNLLNGQINFLVLALCVGALAASAGRRPMVGALLWGAANATKLVTLALAPWWLIRGFAGAVIVGAAASTLLAPGYIGARTLFWTVEYFRDFVAGTLAGAAEDGLRFSLGAIVAAWLPSLPWLLAAGAVVVIAAVTLVDLRRGDAPNADLHAFALYLAAIPLASPKSETHHLAFAIPAAFLGAIEVLTYRVGSKDWRRRALVASAALFWIGHVVLAVRNVCWFASLVTLAATTAAFVRASASPSRSPGPPLPGA